tara:strand:+ start:1421 stop:1687 length:267 start_codon:yes stop_codon:yes gene_type:complete
MSKKEKEEFDGQVKPKLKIKVNTPTGEVQYFSEYNLAAMLSDQIVRVNNLEQQMKGLLDGMAKATEDIPQPGVLNMPQASEIKIPKLS